MDKHAPLIKKIVDVRESKLSYTNEIKHQKQKVRRCEKIWHKYKEEHLFNAYKVELVKYRRMLRNSR